ncbi:MAG: DUF1295 domain-containing protein, partial [bacterium]|nr:DUF1295 domain-containing protein [bacterium]
MFNYLYKSILIAELILAPIIFILLSFISAPYGRFKRRGWGPSIKSRTAWIIMELPSLIIPVFMFIKSETPTISIIFLIIWLSHYIHRTLIYPFRINDPLKSFSILIMFWGLIFNTLNSFVNFCFLFFIRINPVRNWFLSWQFIAGVSIFIFGYIINKKSDSILRNLRLRNKKEYSIPYDFLFKWISSPNYLGEILEWAGWAILTWSLAGFAFFLFTVANL